VGERERERERGRGREREGERERGRKGERKEDSRVFGTINREREVPMKRWSDWATISVYVESATVEFFTLSPPPKLLLRTNV
jgi:hypothetical protein